MRSLLINIVRNFEEAPAQVCRPASQHTISEELSETAWPPTSLFLSPSNACESFKQPSSLDESHLIRPDWLFEDNAVPVSIPHVHRQHTTTICRSILSPAVPCAESNW